MKFEFGFSGPGRRNLIIGLIALVIIASIIVIVLRSRSTYQFPIPVTDTSTEGGSLTTAIALCTTNYRQALQQGLTDSPTPKATCVQNAVNAYFTAKCPFVTAGTAPSVANGQSSAQVTAYNQYSGGGGISGGGDAGAVTGSTQYINLGYGTLPNGITSTMVTKARKADLTGPTRKYIETACTGFYKPADSSATDFSSVYPNWANSSSAANVPIAAGVNYGFYAPNVTGPKVYEWALKAGTPITVLNAVAADSAVSTTKSIQVNGAFPTAFTNAKVKVAGITGVVTGTVTAGSSSITLTYTSQTVPAIPAGTVINKSTASAISSVTFSSGTVDIPNTSGTPTTAISSVTLNLASTLDDSLATNSPVLISGSTISGPITITSGAGTSAVTISFNSQTFPILPTGSTIENVIETPIAAPVVPTPPLYVSVAKASVASSTSSGAITLNAAPGSAILTASGAITIPSLGLTSGITGATTTAGAVTTITLTSTPAITWPAIPAGTMIFLAGQPITAASGTTNTLYNKVGTLSSQSMLNWQIAQVIGPGTYWNTAGTSAVAWGY